MENIYDIEQQRAEQQRTAQKEQAAAQEAATLKALLPAYTYGIQTGDIAGAGNLVPPEMRPQIQQYIDALTGKSPEEVKSALIGSLSSSQSGQEALAAIQRAETIGVQRGQLGVSQAELAQRIKESRVEAQRGNKMEYDYRDEVDADGTPTGRVIAFPKYTYGEELPSGRVVGAGAVGAAPIGTEVTPNVAAPGGGAGGVRVAPAKTAKEEDFTEREGKSLNFALRMIDSDNIANELEKENVLTTDAVTNAVTGVFRALPTAAGGNIAEQLENALNVVSPTLSPEEQRLARAQLDFVTAVLRSESGAEIKTSEFPAEYRKYFAVAGDKGNVKLLADKKRARQNAIKGMKAQAGKRGAKEIDRIVGETGVTATPLTPGVTLDGFEYLGD
jgi:hypothetical protein